VARHFKVGQWTVAPDLNSLERDGRTLRLEPKVMQVLLTLAEQPGEVVTKEELIHRVWAETFVTDDVLIRSISELRKAFGDNPREPTYIQTVAKGGYRILVPVISDGREQGRARRQNTMWQITLAAFVVFAIAASAAYYYLRTNVRPASVMLAVLAFENLSGDPEQVYFSDGLTEEMTDQLGRLQPEQLRVIARTSSMRYKGSNKSIAEIGRELHADYVIEGSVRQEGGKVRISAQLIQVKDESELWTRSFDRDLSHILELQGEVAQAIVNEIKVKLTPSEQARLASARPVNPEAHEAYLKGRYYWNKRTRSSLKKSVQYFEQAIAKDPSYAVAYAGLADSYSLFSRYEILPSREAYPKAKAAALKALQIDDHLAEAHATLGEVKASYDWDWASAEREFKRALELNPGSPMPHYWYSYSYLTPMGRHAEAVAEMKRALELDPLSLMTSTNLAGRFLASRQYDQAIEQLQKTLELDPDFGPAHDYLREAYLQKEVYDKAITESREDKLELARIYALSGKKSEALKLLPELKEQAKHRDLWPIDMAELYAALGEKDEAFAWLENAFDEKSQQLTYLNSASEWDPLRSDHRFEDIVRRIGLPH
jgi:TolB-like protein/DNA-binding winged helix-turn-helix (wHTH) protein/Tfp pilus assembly protein PilF